MSEPVRRFELPTPEMLKLQDAVNKALAGAAKVNLFIRNDPDRTRYCIVIQDGPKRWTSENDAPLDEGDSDEIVSMVRALLSAPRPVHAKYQPFEM